MSPTPSFRGKTTSVLVRTLRGAMVCLTAASAILVEADATTIDRNGTNNDLNLDAAWVGGLAPGEGDIARWDTLSTANLSQVMGGNLSWAGIILGNPSGTNTVTIPSTGGFTLSLGASGIDMTGVGDNNFTISSLLEMRAAQSWNVASGRTLIVTGNLSGTNDLTVNSSGSGTVVLSGLASFPFTGNVIVNAGSLAISSGTADASLNQYNAVTLNGANASSMTLGTVGSGNAPNVTIAGLNGTSGSTVSRAGTGTGGTRTLTLAGLGSSSYGGTISNGVGIVAVTKNGLGDQDFSGSNSYTAATLLNGGGQLTLSGAAGALSATSALTIANSTLELDSSASNNTDRVNNAATVSMLDANLNLIGNAASATTETMGSLTVNAGGSTITVDRNGNATGPVLTFSSLARNVSGQINFVGVGGTLGGGAASDPKILFTTNPGLTNGVIANSGGSTIKGFATVNGTDFASYDATNGVIAVASTAVSGALATASTQNSRLTDNATIAGSTVVYNTLKIDAGVGKTLSLTGAGNLSTNGILLAGTNDFTIQNTGGGNGGLSGNDVRFYSVNDANTTLNIGVTLTGSSNDLVKGGAGFVALTGASNQLGFGAARNISINEGTLRGTTTNLGGGTSAGGAFTLIKLRGGVLEIDGGGLFSRAIDLSGTASGGGIAWESNTTTDFGSGGFSAINGNATVTLVTTIGGGTAANLVWGDGAFVSSGQSLIMGSTKADSRVDFTNNIGLDNGATAAQLIREIRVLDNSSSTSDVARLSGTISGVVGTGLAKTGDGTLELTAANTYGGQTFVTAGTLLVNNVSGSGTGSGQVTVDTGATLGGTGFVGGVTATTDVMVSGFLAPGDPNASGGIGTLTIGSGLQARNTILDDGATFNIQTGVGFGNNDKLVMFGDFDLTGNQTLALSGTLDGINNYEIASWTGTGTNINFETVTGLTGGYSVQYNANNIVLVIPEPSSVALLLGGVGFVVMFRRRRA